jgi:hypothetical protein
MKMPRDKKVIENFNYIVGKEAHIVELPKYCWNPYKNTYPINYLNDEKMEAFLWENTNNSYNKDYVDIVIDAGADKDMIFSNAVISYKAANKSLKLIGLPIGKYIIQLYTVKKGHDGSYKIITYENYDLFSMGRPEISSEEFDKENNVYKIDFIKTTNSDKEIQVDVNLITKIEKKIKLTADNLRSNLLPEYNIAEKNKETKEEKGIGETGKIILNESTQKNFLFPLDIVFVIDNSGSMQRDIDAVKDGLTTFGQELLDRGFDVKYNLITFGPLQTSDRIGNWSGKIYNHYDNDYMAIYKEKWFDGSTLEKVKFENIKKKEEDELIDALDNIISGSGYLYGQENSAWGIHYAIEKLRTNGRYLNYSGEITDNSNSGDMPSEKMIIFLTDENMDTRDKLGKNTLEVLGYDHYNVLKKLYAKLNSTYNGMADNINLTGIFHVRRKGNIARDTNLQLTRYREEGVLNLGYKYSWGVNKDNHYWEEWDDRETPIVGIAPIDTADIYHTDFKLYNTGNNFFMYEMGENGENVKDDLLESINNLGIIQRWELSYLTPFNRYDGTTRTVDFKLINIFGIDESGGGDPTHRTKEIKNLDDPADNPKAKIEDRQYTVKGEKLVVEFKDPNGTSPKLSVVDKRGVIKFLAKSRYYETDNGGENIIIEDIIKDYSLNVLKTDGTLLFSRTTGSIDMRLSEDGWSLFKITKSNLETILDNRKKTWIKIKNLPIGDNPEKEILSYIEKFKYRIDRSNNYEIYLKKSEVDELIDHDLKDDPKESYFNLVVDGSHIRIAEKHFKNLMNDRSDTWYELNNNSNDSNLFSGISSEDFERLDENRYRIRLSDLDLKGVLNSNSGEELELRISKTKLEAIDGDLNDFKDFAQQGWYEFNVILTDAEMDILRDAKLNKVPIEYIDLEATAANDLFTQTKILKDVEIDITPPKITEIEIVDTTLREFLNSMVKLDNEKLFIDTEMDNYSGYTVDNKSKFSSILNYSGSSVKKGDLIDITLMVEDKNLNENDIYINIEKMGWKKPIIDKEKTVIDTNKFKLRWEKVRVDGISGIIKIKNTIEDRYGNTGDQNFGILNIDTTDIIPKISITDKNDDPINVHLSDGKYYVNEDYNIELSEIGDLYRAGIGDFKYNKTKADLDSNNNYYGNSTYYHCSPNGLYTGGIKETNTKIQVDSDHKTDGEYIGVIYEMSKSGKLVDIIDYRENNLDKILDLNYDETSLTKTTIMVDTIKPVISNVSIINKTFIEKYKVNSVDNGKVTCVKDKDQVEVSFDIKDFNIYPQEIGIKDEGGLLIKGGYLLELIEDPNTVDSLVGTIKKAENTNLVDTYTVTYIFTINDSSMTEKVIEFNIKGEDKAGNQTTQKKKVILNNNKPKDVILKVYEEVKNWDNITTQRIGDKNLSVDYNGKTYKFTKGGPTSLIKNPVIFTSISGIGADIRYLKIGEKKAIDLLLDILGKTGEIEIDGGYNKFITDSMNIVMVTPISVSGVKGDEIEFRFIVDTRVNTSYLQDGIIGNLIKGKIDVDLSQLEELVGIDGYSYVFTIKGQTVDSGSSGKNSNRISGNSFATIQNKSINNIINIDTSKFQGGSRGDLKITIWDRLGHEKIFEKIYFIPTKSLGVKAAIEEETKQRESKIRIIGEGSNDKFELESCIDSNLE